MKNGRKDFAEIAEEIGVSKNTIWKHYQEMQKEGIIIGATTQINYADIGHYIFAEILIKNATATRGQIEEIVHKMPNADLIPHVSRGNIVIIMLLKKLIELENAKNAIRPQFSSGEIKTLIWTGIIRNTPENLSFGLSENVVSKARETQSQPTTNVERETSELDETNTKIVDKLTENGRSPFRRIAKEIGVTTDTVARRYKKLKRNGTVNVVIQINPEKIGYHGTLECRIELRSRRNLSSTIDALSKIPDVFHISGTSGDYDLHVWALIRDLKHLFTTQEKIASIPDLGKMDSEINETFLNLYPTPRQHISTI